MLDSPRQKYIEHRTLKMKRSTSSSNNIYCVYENKYRKLNKPLNPQCIHKM